MDLWRQSSPILLLREELDESRLLRTLSRWVFNISKDGESEISLGNLF